MYVISTLQPIAAQIQTKKCKTLCPPDILVALAYFIWGVEAEFAIVLVLSSGSRLIFVPIDFKHFL